MTIHHLRTLASQLKGNLYYDSTMRTLYATDASAYREMPQAVAIPRTKDDLGKLIAFARTHKTSLIPRAAGTSLAGQVVGAGIVVDTGKHLNRILELNAEEKWVRVEPGVVRDELNLFLREHGLQFGPETSTANRAMIGGMVGNNSCGSNSIVYGSTREHVLELKALLSDGTEATFGSLAPSELEAKCLGLTPGQPVPRGFKPRRSGNPHLPGDQGHSLRNRKPDADPDALSEKECTPPQHRLRAGYAARNRTIYGRCRTF